MTKIDSLEMLRWSLERLIGEKGNILVLGDFNLPKFSWFDSEPSINPDCRPTCGTVYVSFEDILDDFNLSIYLIFTRYKIQETLFSVGYSTTNNISYKSYFPT